VAEISIASKRGSRNFHVPKIGTTLSRKVWHSFDDLYVTETIVRLDTITQIENIVHISFKSVVSFVQYMMWTENHDRHEIKILA
jgi:hypothetical protein